MRTWLGRLISGLLGAAVAVVVTVVAIIAFIAVIVAAFAALAAVVGGILAWFKRETWTKPAYRWARDKSGQWRYTPWNPADAGMSDAVVEPISGEKIAS